MTGISNSVVFITGTFISNNCWDEWISYFEREGYNCIAPAWPYKNASPEELRNRTSDDAIALNTISSLTEHFATVIKGLSQKPILIGHSLGGLLVQLLLQRKLGVAGVAIHSFPSQGINRFRLSFLKTIWETMKLFTSDRETYMISFSKWKNSIAAEMTTEQQKQSYYKYAIPESKKITRNVFNNLTKIDFTKSHPPLLFTSGGKDKLIPASLNYSDYKKYGDGKSIVAYKEFKDHMHFVFDPPESKAEADFILRWLSKINNLKSPNTQLKH
jgi:pimeloyl-ACP methyl ester carboxylesterase